MIYDKALGTFDWRVVDKQPPEGLREHMRLWLSWKREKEKHMRNKNSFFDFDTILNTEVNNKIFSKKEIEASILLLLSLSLSPAVKKIALIELWITKTESYYFSI